MATFSEDMDSEGVVQDRSNLGGIYPTPKTYEQRRRERKDMDELRARRRPKHVIATAGVKLYSVLVGLLLALQLGVMAMGTNVITGVFLSFLIGLVWFGYATWMAMSISGALQKVDSNAAPFLLLYVCTYPALAYMLYGFTAASLVAAGALMTCLHFMLVYILLKLTMKYA